MARMEIRGMDAAIRQMEELASGSDAAAREALLQGAQLIARQLSAAAPERTGALAGSIRPDKVTSGAGGGYTCRVGPTGNHPKTGEPLAKIGNILEYGRSYGRTKKAGLAWFFSTVAAWEQDALQLMEEVFKSRQGG